MKNHVLSITLLTALWTQTGNAIAQSFSGTNASGESRAINFTVPPGVTNISLYVSNSPTAFSHLFLKQGATPSETDYDFSSQLDGHYNDINIEVPELAPTDYVLLVRTPTNSLTHEFVVRFGTNEGGMRSGEFSVSKPQVATITGDFYKENFPFHYFRFEIPSNSPGWRLVLTTAGTNPASLYVLKDAAPQTWSYYRAAIDQTNGTVVLTDTEATPGVWYVGVTHPLEGPVVYTLRSETNYLAGTVVWDPGSTCAGETWFTNASATGGDYYFKVRPVDATNGAWRTVLRTVGGEADLYLAQGLLPTTISFHRASTCPGTGIDEVVLYGGEFDTNQDWFILVHATPGAQWRLLTGNIHIETLDWDPGLTSHGTAVYTNDCDSGLSFFFKITAQNTEIGAWRTALNVESGEADVLMRYADLPRPGQANFYSQRAGPDGFVLHSSQFSAAQDWYLLVCATNGAQWNLVSGEAFAHDLGALADDESSGTNVTIGAEGMAFFKTTVDADTLAWSLWLHGATNELRVRKSSAPHPVSYAGGEPLPQPGQMLVVPAYLAAGSFNGYYFVNVPGTPGENVLLDSRKHAVADIDFNSTNSPVVVSNWGYRSYRVQVPVQQIAWQVSVVPVSGNPNFAVRRDTVPNEWNNDAFSEVGGAVIDSVTLVPPGLSDGTFFITVYGDTPFSFVLHSGTPVVTDVPFFGTNTNADLGRVGWRFFRVTDIESQLGYLGWDLLLQNAPTGTEIALRRNAVPGRWNSRMNNSTYVGGNGYFDFSSTSEELQRPGHQADIWYIGVYNPSSALNAFRLIRQPFVPQTVDIDSNTPRTDVPPGHWEYLRIDVPTNGLGWDLRLVDVTNGNPQMVVRRDLLPSGLQNGPYSYPWYWYWFGDAPWFYGSWPSGSQWVYSGDWTGDGYDATGANAHVNTLALGKGNPLEPGTYYIGVYADGMSSYTLQSRGIGDGLSIPVRPLAYSGAGASHTNTLPAREAAYYQVDIASNTPSWKIKLSPTSGEALLLVQKGALPNVTSGSSALPHPQLAHTGGKKMQKAGDEYYVLLPAAGETNIPAGTYYLAVVSEGVNPHDGRIGEGDTDYVLESQGALSVTNLGTVTYGHDLTVSSTLGGGEVAAYQFSVPSNTATIELQLERIQGTPTMALVVGAALPAAPDGYGTEGGIGGWSDPALITIANPTSGGWSVVVQAAYPYADANFSLLIHAEPPVPVDFNAGSSIVSNQQDRTWQFFQIDVPTNAVGWDVRLVNVTQGSPGLVVRRDLLPEGLQNGPYPYPWASYWWYDLPWVYGNWPSGSQWCGGGDWTDAPYTPEGADAHVRTLAMGMGNPLEPGTYYVGVYAGGVSSYTLQSRGIGDGLSIPVRPLAYSGAGASHTNTLPAREAAYYQVDIASNTPSWKIKLSPTSGEALLLVQKGALPNVTSGSSALPHPQLAHTGGKKMQKAGDEYYVLLPAAGETNIPAGTYYLAVVSEGVNPHDGRIGEGDTDYVLESQGALSVTNLGTVTYGHDLTVSSTLGGGEVAAYQFSVPSNTATIELQLERIQGTPTMALVVGAALPAAPDGYGTEGGIGGWSDPALITIANPTSGGWSVVVQAAYPYADANFSLLIHAEPPVPVDFNAGSSIVSNQQDRTWQFFQIDVPTNAVGWDVRLVNVTQGSPGLVVRRDLLPEGLQNGPYPYPWASYWWYDLPWVYGNWPSGSQWCGGGDWTDAPYTPEGADAHVRTLAMGMGNPLEPGTYYVGVYAGGVSSYTLQSRGIGDGLSIPVRPLAYSGAGASHTNTLPAREAAYYQVDIASNTPSWKIKLSPTSGEALLLVQKGALPNVTSGSSALPHPQLAHTGGKKMQKAGDEYYVLLPAAGETNIPAGTYYLAVVSEGVNPHDGRIGEGDTDYVLESQGALSVTNLGTVTYGHDLTVSSTLGGGEVAAYQFSVPSNAPGIEVRLEDRVGNPIMTLAPLAGPASAPDGYGAEGGGGGDVNANLLSVPNPATGLWSVVVQAASPYADASFTLRVTQPPIPDLNFTASQNTNGSTNAFSGLLADYQRAYFRVEVPAMSDGVPVIGWRLDLVLRQGSASVRVRKDLLPADDGIPGTSPYSSPTTCIVPPYLTPGVWYVEVLGSGGTDFTLASSALLPERTWTMPAPGQPTATNGLTAPEFGDTGTDAGGFPILDPQTGTVTDRGVDLEQGRFHYYAIVVPENNTGVLRTWLEAISGNPDLYIRAGAPPTISHGPCVGYPWCPATLFDRAQTGATTDYGNWVPLNGRYESRLTPGVWYLAIQAAGNSNVRYRLHLSNGNIQNLEIDGGSVTNILAGGDWRYYRVQIPSNAPANWNLTFSQQAGDVVMYLRDTIPPGFGASPGYYYDWASDQKNYGPYPSFDPPGTYKLTVPPVRPGHTYYLGFRAVNDAVFSVSSSTSGGVFDGTNVLAFYGGYVTNVLQPFGSALFRINVPADAVRWRSHTVRGPDVAAYLEQGTIPIPGLSHLGNAEPWWDGFWNIYLLSPNNWPWVPAQSYFLLITNTSGVDKPFSFSMSGRNLLTDDEDNDGLPDYWETQHFNNTWSQIGTGDADGDGFTNVQEYLADTDPTDATSYLRITGLDAEPGGVRIDWRGGIQATQVLQRRLTLGGTNDSWLDLFTNLPPTQPASSYTNLLGTNFMEFYRIRAERP